MVDSTKKRCRAVDIMIKVEPMSFYPEPTPEEVNGPPKCEWCQDTKVIYGESPHRPQGETCPMC